MGRRGDGGAATSPLGSSAREAEQTGRERERERQRERETERDRERQAERERQRQRENFLKRKSSLQPAEIKEQQEIGPRKAAVTVTPTSR